MKSEFSIIHIGQKSDLRLHCEHGLSNWKCCGSVSQTGRWGATLELQAYLAIPQQHTEDLAVLLLGETGWDTCMISCLPSGQSSSKNKWRPVTPPNSLLGGQQQQSKRIVPGSPIEPPGKNSLTLPQWHIGHRGHMGKWGSGSGAEQPHQEPTINQHFSTTADLLSWQVK